MSIWKTITDKIKALIYSEKPRLIEEFKEIETAVENKVKELEPKVIEEAKKIKAEVQEEIAKVKKPRKKKQ